MSSLTVGLWAIFKKIFDYIKIIYKAIEQGLSNEVSMYISYRYRIKNPKINWRKMFRECGNSVLAVFNPFSWIWILDSPLWLEIGQSLIDKRENSSSSCCSNFDIKNPWCWWRRCLLCLFLISWCTTTCTCNCSHFEISKVRHH